MQIFPKTTPVANSPPVGLAGEENGRAILGTVPVEPDGSAHFIVPAGKGLLFQALDPSGYAYQTMRSLTYVQPGERVACVGCHESRQSAPRAERPPGDAPSGIGDRPGRTRRRAVLVRARRAAGPRQALRAVPWRRAD